jgi:hypothetical protein
MFNNRLAKFLKTIGSHEPVRAGSSTPLVILLCDSESFTYIEICLEDNLQLSGIIFMHSLNNYVHNNSFYSTMKQLAICRRIIYRTHIVRCVDYARERFL